METFCLSRTSNNYDGRQRNFNIRQGKSVNLQSVRRKWQSTTISRSLSVLTRQDQRRIILVILFQISLSILDLIGVALAGLS